VLQERISFEQLDRILPRVEKPARYTGNEWNSVLKPWDEVRLHLALAFPDVYEIGMSNLGLAILYDEINKRGDMLAERVYAPWPDMAAAMRSAGIPLFSLESRHPIRSFDIVGFSLSYELSFTTVLEMLDLAGLPQRSEARDDIAPLVIAGGSACHNPEPMAPFFDLFVIGDGEEALPELAEAYARFLDEQPSRHRDSRAWKRRFLRQAMKLDGVYVPEFYHPLFAREGHFQTLDRLDMEAPARVRARKVRALPTPPLRPLVPNVQTIHDRATIEIRRGCGQGCRFCQAGVIYRPVRERPVDEVVSSAETIIANTGYDELGLLSLSSCDYRRIEELVQALLTKFEGRVALSLPSLRVDSFSVSLAEMVQKRRRSGLTFAPEAGTQRLRDVINKKVTEEDLFQVAEAAFSRSWQRLKLYFMVGLPGETDADVHGIVNLARRVLAIGRRHHGRKARVGVSVATFIPKPHTPFQWAPLIGESDLERRQGILRRGLRKPGLELSWHDVRMSYLEALLSRGDRRLAAVIQRAWQLGARLDPWNEHFCWQAWQQALEDCAIQSDDYVRRPRQLDEPLPWDFVDTGVRRSYLRREWERALAAQTTPSCPRACSHCGVSETYDLACWE